MPFSKCLFPERMSQVANTGNRYRAQLFNGILQRLLALIAERAPDLTPHLDEFPTNLSAAELTTRFIQSMEIYAQALEKAGYELPIVCLLDEIERILPQAGDAREKVEEFNACFGALRALIQEQQILGLMVTDVHPDCNRINEWPQEGVPTNPVSNFFKEVFLGPFSEEETTTMITGLGRWMGRRFDDETLARIHYESGGHPFVARQLASLLYTKVTQTQATADGEALVLFSSAKRYLEEALAYSNVLKHYIPENIWAPLKKRNFDSAMVILKILAANERSDGWLIEPKLREQLGTSFTGNQLLDAFFWLEATGLVLQDEIARPARFRIRISLLAQWLRMDMRKEEIQQWQVV
jgi:hypothetical protein